MMGGISLELLFMIFKNIKKGFIKNLFITIQLFISFLVMLLVLGSMEYLIESSNKALNIIKANIIRVYNGEKNELNNDNTLTLNSFNLKPQETANNIFPKCLEDTLNLIKKDSRVKSIGKAYSTVLYEDSLKNSSENSIRANTRNLLIICNDEVANTYYNYKTIKGENFSSYYSKNKKEDTLIPILVGPVLERDNPLGSVVEIPKCFNDETKLPYKFKIIGVLDPFMPTVDDERGDTKLDNGGFVVIIPRLVMNTGTDLNYTKILFQLKDEKALASMDKEYRHILSYSDTQFTNISDKFEAQKSDDSKGSIGKIVYCILLLTLCSFGVISISLATVIKRRKEIGIRFAIGAGKKDMVAVLAGEFVALFAAAEIAAILVAFIIASFLKSDRISPLVIDLRSIGISSLTMLVFMIISVLPLIIKMFRLSPIEFIRNN